MYIQKGTRKTTLKNVRFREVIVVRVKSEFKTKYNEVTFLDA